MNPIPIITAIPNIRTDSYKKRWSLGVGLTFEVLGSGGVYVRLTLKVKRWSLGVGVTMEVKRWSLGVGWRYLAEGSKNAVDNENDHGYAIACLINLLTTSERVFHEKLIVPLRVKCFSRCMETDVSLDRQLFPSSARLIKSTSFRPIYEGPSLILSSHLSRVF
jgi:hypothetical protein